MLANAVSIMFIGSFIIPAGLYALTRDKFYLKLIVGLAGANIGVEGIKRIFGSDGIFGRPEGARGCDLFCAGGDVAGNPGFPSGHMVNVSMFVAALWTHTGSPYVGIVGVPWIAAMGWSRWTKRCHNWQQILAGAAMAFQLAAS